MLGTVLPVLSDTELLHVAVEVRWRDTNSTFDVPNRISFFVLPNKVFQIQFYYISSSLTKNTNTDLPDNATGSKKDCTSYTNSDTGTVQN